MKNFVILMALAALFQEPGFESAVLVLSGASSLEELDESTMQHYRDLNLRPVDLNRAGRARLLSCGLLNAFQVASLLEWRQSSGDILSYVELGLIDGFSPEYAEALKPFTRLESDGPPGMPHKARLHHDLTVKGSAKENDGHAYAAGLKYKASLGEVAEFNWASRTTYTDRQIGTGTVSAAYYGSRHLAKVVLGHFNARFGQGLALWSGFSMSRYGSVSAFRRNGSGFTPTGSFSPEHCGVAADFSFGQWTAGAAYSFTARTPVGYVSWCGRRLTACVSASSHSASADFKLGVKNTSVFGELAWNGSPAALLGAVWSPVYGSKYGLLMSWQNGTPEAALGLGLKGLDAVAMVSSKQVRVMTKYAPELSAGPFTITPALRLAAKRTDEWRLESRGELKLAAGPWALNSRLDVVHCKALAWLANTEIGCCGERFNLWLRGTLFCIDNWADRIYVYERDAPGNFNVPAYYGRGWNASLTGSWKPSRRHALYLKLSYVEYPWTTDAKPSKAEVKLQYRISL